MFVNTNFTEYIINTIYRSIQIKIDKKNYSFSYTIIIVLRNLTMCVLYFAYYYPYIIKSKLLFL